MKKSTSNPLRLIPVALGLVVALLVNHARAAVTYWDPEGTVTGTYTGQASSKTPPVPGTLAGTWETASWSTAGGGAATPVAWVENTAACFAVGAGATNSGDATSTTTFAVTMNANHTVAGFFDGPLSPNSCKVTIQGSGTMTMVAGNLNAMGLATSTDGSIGVITIAVPLAGGTTAGICAENGGEVFLNGDSTAFAGGTYLGYSGSSFASGVWHFNANSAFGTSPIILLNAIGGALVTETSGLNITNAVTMWSRYSANINTIGWVPLPQLLNLDAGAQSFPPKHVTFSGPWQLSNGSGYTGANIYANTSPWGNYTVLTLNTGYGAADPSDLVNISGPLSGSCALTKGGSGILQLSGDNSAFSGPLSITNGTVRIGYPTGLGCNGAVSTNGTVTVVSGATYSGTLDLNGYAVNAALILNGTGNSGNGALVNSNLTSTAVLNAPSGVLAALITTPFTSTTIAPPVTATVTGGGGSGATAFASLGVTPATFTVTANNQVYSAMPTITVTGGGGSNAIVPLPLVSGVKNPVTGTAFVTAPGFGYSSAPTVTVAGGTTSGAGTKPTVTANANNFQLMGIQITAPGSGYTSPPTISLSGTGVDAGVAVGLISSVTLASATSIGGPGNMIINSPIGDSGLVLGLTKVGAGTVTLGGVNTYSGATTVTGGKLVGVVGGSCASSAVDVQTGRTLGVSIPDSTKQWTCASLTFDDSTTTNEFNFGSVTPSTTLAPLNVTGTVTFTGAPTIAVLGSGLAPGTYPLITCSPSGLLGSVPTTANLSLPPHVSATLSNDGTTLSLVVSGNTEPLKWAVDGTATWDINTTANWKDATPSSVNYLENTAVPPVGDAVVFDDTYFADARTVTLNTTVTPVAVTANSASSYTISGTGGIAGETGLSQQGAGTLELDTVNTFTGGTTIAAPGALTIGSAGQLGGGTYSAPIANNGTLTFNSTAAQTLAGPISGTGALVQNGASTLVLSAANTYSGGTTIGAAGTLQIGDGALYNGATVAGNILDNGNLVLTSFYPQTYSGNLSGTGSLTVNSPTSLTLSGVNSYSGSTTINAVSLIFNNAGPQTLSGNITGPGALVQAGAGTLTLNATTYNSYTGGTIINAGILSVNAIDGGGFNPSAIPGTGVVTLGGGTLQYTGSSPAELGNTVSGTGTIDVPSGSLQVDLAKSGTITKTSGGTLILAGTLDNASLGLTINGGTVTFNKASSATAHAVGATTTVNNTGTLKLSGTGGDQIYSGVNVTVNTGGVFDANGLSEGMTSLTLFGNGTGSGPLINNTGTPSTITCTATPGGFVLGNNISFASSGNITLAGVITNLNGVAYGITNAGTGTLTLSSQNRFSGGLTINAGATVSLGNFSAAGTNDTITIIGNGILICTASDSATTTYTNAITGGSTAVIKVNTASGNTYLGGDMTAFTGTIQCNSGQTVIGVANNAAFPLNSAATWVIANGATLDLQTPYITDAAHVTINGAGGANGALRLDACNQTGPVLLNAINCTFGNGNAGVATISGVISDGGNNYGVAKVGANTVVLTAVNTYTGTTTNAAGILEISPTGSVKGNVTVTGGTLQLDGTANLASTATLNLNTTPAANTVSNNFTGTQTITALNFGAVSMAQGTWGAVGSGATHQNAAFGGLAGVLNITSGGTATTTTLGSVPSTLCFGAALNLSATVTGGTDGDTVQFLDGVTVLGTGTLSSGAASYSTSGLAVGLHSITAKYLGNNTADSSTSSPAASVTVNVCVSKSPVTITSVVNNGSTITINYTGGAGASFTLMESPVLPSPAGQNRDNWTPVGGNQPSTPGSFTFTPSGNSVYTIRSN